MTISYQLAQELPRRSIELLHRGRCHPVRDKSGIFDERFQLHATLRQGGNQRPYHIRQQFVSSGNPTGSGFLQFLDPSLRLAAGLGQRFETNLEGIGLCPFD